MAFNNTITIGQDGLKTRVFVVRNEYCFNFAFYQLVDIKVTDKSKEDNWSTGTFIAGELVYENVANPGDKVIVEFVAFYNDLEITGQHMFVYKKDSDKFAYDIIFNSDKVIDGPIVTVRTTMNYTIEDFK